MSRGLRLGGRVFVPSAGFTVVALLLCALCVRLGTWQWHKGMQREQEWTRFARGADQVIALGARAVSDVPLFQRVSVTGRLESARQFLLDNRTYRGRAGYEVLTPLARAGAAVLLVDRGWVPFSGSRRSEEHTSELQSHSDLVCRLLLEKKKQHARKKAS